MKLKVVYLLLLGFLLATFPVKLGNSMSADVNTSVDVNLPIEELKELIQQLEDVGSQLIGDAGIQMRETIRELSSQIEQRIDQLQDAALEVLKEAEAALKDILDDLVKQANDLLKTVQNMINNSIECIDEALAKRIAQIHSTVSSLLSQVETTIKNSVDHIYMRADQIIETGTNRVALLVNNTFSVIAKLVVLIFGLIILFWLVKTLWKGSFPNNLFAKIAIPVIMVALIGGAVFLLVSPTAMASIIGQKVELPKWETACADGDSLYDEFFKQYNNGASKDQLEDLGEEALEQLNWCIYASASSEVGQGKSIKIDEIAAILYPPVAVPDLSDPDLANCEDEDGNKVVSIDPRWFDKYAKYKINVIKELYEVGTIKANIPDPTIKYINYETRLNTLINVKFEAPAKFEERFKTDVKMDAAKLEMIKIHK